MKIIFPNGDVVQTRRSDAAGAEDAIDPVYEQLEECKKSRDSYKRQTFAFALCSIVLTGLIVDMGRYKGPLS